MSATLWLAELTIWDPALPGTRVLRYANRAFCTRPSETPANEIYSTRLRAAALLKRDVFDSKTTGGRSRTGYQTLELINKDGALDGFMDYAVDGRAIVIYRGVDGAAYPAGFTKYVGTMQRALVSRSTVTIKMRDRATELDVPLQPTKFAGSNVLPAGVEGVADDLQGKPKPIVVGTVKNITARLVNTSKLIYQVNDGAVASIDAVYDRGIPLDYGISWTAPASGFGASAISGLAYDGAGLYVAVSAGNKIRTSPDGVTWTGRVSPYGGGNFTGASFGAGVFLATNDAGQTCTSPDGIVWTDQPNASFSPFSKVINTVTFGNGFFVISGQDGRLDTSPDGITWTAQTSGFAPFATVAAIYGNGLHLVSGGTATGAALATSSDGVTWTRRALELTPSSFQAFAYYNGIFVAFGSGTEVATSPDGITWLTRAPSNPFGVVCAVGSPRGFFSFPGGGLAFWSLDGAEWIQLPDIPNTTSPNVALYAGGIFLAGGGAGKLVTTSSSVYASLVDLEDDTKAPLPGCFKEYPGGGYFRLGSSPAGTPTSDVTEGATSADRTHAQCFKRLMQRFGYVSGTDFSAADITAADIANGAEAGWFWSEEIKRSAAIDEIAGSGGFWWGPDNQSLFRFQQFTLPSGPSDFAFTANSLKKPLDTIETNDDDRGLPAWRSILRWGRNYTPQNGSDLAGGVTDARRAFVALEWREAKDEDASVQTVHPLAPEISEDSGFANQADAIAEVQRRQVIRGIARLMLTAVVELNDDNADADLFDTVDLTHQRFGLSAGKQFRILGIDPNPAKKEATLIIWGGV
jgi:hypothetical protein